MSLYKKPKLEICNLSVFLITIIAELFREAGLLVYYVWLCMGVF